MEPGFVHLSDPHLTSLEQVSPRELLNKRILGYLSWRRKRRFEHRPEVLQTLVEHLLQKQSEQIVITGDLTHIGLPSEFRQAARWLKSLGEPDELALIPGNHECYVGQPWEQSFANWAEYLGSAGAGPGEYPSLKTTGELAFIGLSSACPTPPFMASGSLGEDQLQRLAKVLEETRRQGLFRVVLVHHSPVPGIEKWRKRLTDAPALSTLLQETGAELVLHGHGHRARHYAIESHQGEIPVLSVPSASALGLYGADVARYNHFQIKQRERGWQVKVDSWGYQVEDSSVALVATRELDLARDHAGKFREQH